MTLLRRAFRNVSRRLFRTMLVSFVLALCVAVLISTIAGVQASKQSTQDMVDESAARTADLVTDIEESTGALVTALEEGAEETTGLAETMARQITVRSGFGRPGSGSSTGEDLDQEKVKAIYEINNVAAVLPVFTEHVGGSGDFKARDYDYVVNGLPLDPSLTEQYAVLPWNIIEGRAVEEEDGNAVLMNEDLVGHFGAGVGDTITIEGTDFEIIGLFYSADFRDQKSIYMSLDKALTLFDESNFDMLQVYPETLSEVDTVVDAIEDLNSNWLVMTMEDMTSRFGEQIIGTQEQQVEKIQQDALVQIESLQANAEAQVAALQDDLTSIENLGIQISLVSAIIGILMIFGLMFYTVRERTREIGVLKALGFNNPDIMKQFMLEGFYLGFLGGLLGIALGAATYSFLGPWLLDTEASLSFEPWYLAVGLGGAALAGALGSAYPAWLASRVSPMEALRRG